MAAISLSVIILTHNEKLHIARALSSVSGIANKVFVVDSGSIDGTREIAQQYGAEVVQHPWINYASQFQWALDNLDISTDWIMRLDADEICDEDLVREIQLKLPELRSSISGVYLKRRHIFMNRWVRHGGRYPLVLLRIWRKGTGRIEQRWMDEHMVLSGGDSVTFSNYFSDHNLNDLTFFTDKHNRYATREAVDVLNQRLGLFQRDLELLSTTNLGQASQKRNVKEGFYNKLPFEIAALMYFFYRYIWQLGFLDGREGTIYHVLQGFWYRYLVGAKVRELGSAITGLEREQAIDKLAASTGLPLRQWSR